MAAFVAEARAAYADPSVRREALVVSSEFAWADSEALGLAEGRRPKSHPRRPPPPQRKRP